MPRRGSFSSRLKQNLAARVRHKHVMKKRVSNKKKGLGEDSHKKESAFSGETRGEAMFKRAKARKGLSVCKSSGFTKKTKNT